jgi:hypothetical protein
MSVLQHKAELKPFSHEEKCSLLSLRFALIYNPSYFLLIRVLMGKVRTTNTVLSRLEMSVGAQWI